MNTIGEKINYLRRKSNLKQNELAEILQISNFELSKIEKNNVFNQINKERLFEILTKIALFFNLTYEELESYEISINLDLPKYLRINNILYKQVD
jgi:transcriptional regulator with XRE-family HTH domain